MSAPSPKSIDFGTCCVCEGPTRGGCVNVITLNQTAPQPGRGWGCLICGVPNNGAVAIACDACMDDANTDRKIRFVCDGWAKDAKRIGIDAYDHQPFDHNNQRHPENAINN